MNIFKILKIFKPLITPLIIIIVIVFLSVIFFSFFPINENNSKVRASRVRSQMHHHYESYYESSEKANNSKANEEDKLYENKYNLTLNHENNIFLAASFFLLKPLIEIYLDSRLESKNIFFRLKQQNFYSKLLTRTPIKLGQGPKIICGQEIIINIAGSALEEKTNLESFHSIRYKVGQSSIPILNIAPLGMKKGEITSIIIPNNIKDELLMARNSSYEEELPIRAGKNSNLIIEIIDVLDSYPEEIRNMQVFTDYLNNRKAKMCGDQIILDYKIKDIEGKVIKAEIINFKAGERKYPIALELAATELQPNVNRTIIVHNDLIKNNKLPSSGLPCSKDSNELKILELKILDPHSKNHKD